MDISWDCYTKHFERVKKLRDVSRKKGGAGYFPFDEHYVMAERFCQRLRDNPRVVPRFVGPACPQRHVEEGEPHALFKATHFMPLRCSGPHECADPSHCLPALSMPASQVLAHRPHCGDNLLCRCSDHEPSSIRCQPPKSPVPAPHSHNDRMHHRSAFVALAPGWHSRIG